MLFPQANDYETILELKALNSLVNDIETFKMDLPIKHINEILDNFTMTMAEKGWRVYTRAGVAWTAPKYKHVEFKIKRKEDI